MLTALGAGAGLATWGGAAARAQAAGAYPIIDFFKGQGGRAAVLSPSGLMIAVLEQIGTAERPHGIIDVIDAADPEGERRRIDLGAIEVEALEWANDRRVLARVAVTATTATRASAGSNIRVRGVEFTSRRIISVDVVSGDIVVLFQDQRQRLRRTLDMGRVVDMLRSDPDHVLMTAWEGDGVLGLHKVNVNTGSAQRIERGVGGTFAWQTQDGVAVMRHDINSRGTVETVHVRAPGETAWRFARRTRVVDAPDFAWVGQTDRPGVVLVSARLEGEDLEAVRELDLRTLAFGAPIDTREGRDVLYGLKDTNGRYLGAAYYGERLEYVFNEPEMAAHHRGLNRFFDDDCDVYLTSISADRNRMIAFVNGPREPGAWYFYDRAARAIVNVAARYDLEPERLGQAELLTVRTRDGASIEAYLTAPPGGRPGPLIVLAHGGPEARDTRRWDRQVQVLAAQGWWVLQPNFRGSGGYGLAFAQQGWTRWGDRMQHDVEDAVAQAVAARGLDGGRVAIMGTSYGGYAALMGAVLRPDLYKAAVAICGVFDLPEMMAWERREDDTPGQMIYNFWTRRIGDPATHGPMLEAASPRRRAAEIACPVILVHGVEDPIVPVIQSRRMRDALRAAGRAPDYVEVPDAGHADWEDPQEYDLMRRYVALFTRAFA